MTNDVLRYAAVAAAHLTRPEGGPWATATDSWCVENVWLCGGFSRSFTSATLAGDYALANHGLDPDWTTAKPGEFDYFTDHICARMPDGTDLMASHSASSLAPGLGYLTVPQYEALQPGQHYRGHSPYFGDETLAPTPTESENPMSNYRLVCAPATDTSKWVQNLAGGGDGYMVVNIDNFKTAAMPVAATAAQVGMLAAFIIGGVTSALTAADFQFIEAILGPIASGPAPAPGPVPVDVSIADAQLATLAKDILAGVTIPAGLSKADATELLSATQKAITTALTAAQKVIVAKIPTKLAP